MRVIGSNGIVLEVPETVATGMILAGLVKPAPGSPVDESGPKPASRRRKTTAKDES